MNVTITRHVDAGDQDADGFFGYYYEYDLLVFSEGEITAVARSYADTPSEVHFLRLEIAGKFRALTQRDMKSDFLQKCMVWLRAHGKTEITGLFGREGFMGRLRQVFGINH